MADTDDAEFRHLQAQVHRLEEDVDDLRARLAYAHLEIEQLRVRVSELTRPMRTAAPRDMVPATVVPITSAELDAALARLRQVRPLPVVTISSPSYFHVTMPWVKTWPRANQTQPVP